jgi:LysR family hydrogen peroxide-inducible transcriptional activator
MIDIIYHMNLRDLQYLAAVARHLHFGKAAEECHVSQPTLSMQLKKLEDTLGVQLFERTNKSVMLTPIGRDITQRAERILAEAEQIRKVASSNADPMAGEIRLGIFPTLAPYLLPSLMLQLGKHFPRLNVLLVEEKTPVLIQKLVSGEIDAAILAMPIAEDLASHTLFHEPFMLAVHSSHRLAKQKSVTLSDMRNEAMLLLEDGHCLREQALEVCHMIGAGEARNFRATSLETLRHMVASGGGITLIPELATHEKNKNLRYIPFEKPSPQRTIGLYWRKTSARNALMENMGAMISKES